MWPRRFSPTQFNKSSKKILDSVYRIQGMKTPLCISCLKAKAKAKARAKNGLKLEKYKWCRSWKKRHVLWKGHFHFSQFLRFIKGAYLIGLIFRRTDYLSNKVFVTFKKSSHFCLTFVFVTHYVYKCISTKHLDKSWILNFKQLKIDFAFYSYYLIFQKFLVGTIPEFYSKKIYV